VKCHSGDFHETLARQLFVKNFCSEFHENPTSSHGRTAVVYTYSPFFFNSYRRDNKWETHWPCAWGPLLLVRYFILVLRPQVVGISMRASRFAPHCHYAHICVCECTDPELRLTNKVTTCSRVLHEKLKVPLLTKEFPPFYGIRLFITVLTTAYY
jgi:hypothetical protein